MTRLNWTRRALLLALPVFILALPAAASATVQVTTSGSTLTVTAAANNDADVITAIVESGGITVTDTVGATAGAGVCTPNGSTQVICIGSYTAVNIDAGGGNDLVATNLPGTSSVSTILGGDGDDGISSDCNNFGLPTLAKPCNEDINSTASSHADTLNGGPGNDTMSGGLGNDTFIGGTGSNTVSYHDHLEPPNGVTATIGAASGNGDQALGESDNLSSGIQNLTGSPDEGGSGTTKDRLVGDAGPNVISAEDGDDTVVGGGGNDTLSGGFGRDTADYSDHAAGVTASLATGTGGSAGEADTLAEFENLTGGSGNDNFTGTGDTSQNVLTGGPGNDTLSGLAGDDILNGNDGNDTLDSTDGGGTGTDVDNCGAGDDSATLDTIDTTDGLCETINGVGPHTPGTYTGPTHTTTGGIPGESGVSGTLSTPKNCVPGNTLFKAKVGVKVKGTRAHKKSYSVTRVKFYLRGKLILDDKRKPFVVNYTTVGVPPGTALAVKAKIFVTIKKGKKKRQASRTLKTTVRTCPAA